MNKQTEEKQKKNFLIMSDLHLGYRAKDLSIKEYQNEISKMNIHFGKLLRHYTKADSTWELIINGDFIDFIQINYKIDPKDSSNYRLGLDEIKFGMNNKEAHILWKLRRIAEIHGAIFKEIAQFIYEGNSFVLIKGNHDIEFYWPKVKKELKNIIASFISFESEEEKQSFFSRIKVKDWMYIQEGLFYIEHGNQYDDYTSFKHFITPLNVMNYKKLEMPYSHVSMRYWINLTKNFETHDLTSWGGKEFLAWMKREGVKKMFMHVFYYFRALFMLLSQVKFTKAFDPYIHLKERYYIKKIANIYKLDSSLFFRINNMKRAPVGESIYGVLSSFYFDVILILLSFIIFLVYSIISAHFLSIFFAFILFLVFSMMLFLVFSYDREIDPENKLLETSKEIAKLIPAKYYIFGHTHHPKVEKIAKNKYYINSGSWILRSPKNIPGEFNHNLSHIIIENDLASLRLWKMKHDQPIDIEDFHEIKGE